MIRTTIHLPVQLHHQLRFVAKGQNTTVAHLMRSLLAQALGEQKKIRMQVVYASLEKVKGIGKGTDTDVSATINERLYGPAGAWKGRDE
jgi:hypothetical protein